MKTEEAISKQIFQKLKPHWFSIGITSFSPNPFSYFTVVRLFKIVFKIVKDFFCFFYLGCAFCCGITSQLFSRERGEASDKQKPDLYYSPATFLHLKIQLETGRFEPRTFRETV